MNAIAFIPPSTQRLTVKRASARRAIDFMDYGRAEWVQAMADARVCHAVGDRGGLFAALDRAIFARGFLVSAMEQYQRATR